jgi:5'-methylthioadenosine phosphorylase
MPRGSTLSNANLMLLVAVVLPPRALDVLGPVVEERTIQTTYGTVGPLALRAAEPGLAAWIQPYSGLPTRTDPRSTLLAAKELGVQRLLNWDAAVAVNPVLGRGQPLIVADYVDFTRHQPTTYFSGSGIGDIEQSPALCPQMAAALSHVLPGAPHGVYLGVDGPRRETQAEARLFRQWGIDVIGQNLVPEVSLAKELELCYAGLVTVGSYSADQATLAHPGEVRMGLELVTEALPAFLRLLIDPPNCNCATVLSGAKRSGLLADQWWAGDIRESRPGG